MHTHRLFQSNVSWYTFKLVTLYFLAFFVLMAFKAKIRQHIVWRNCCYIIVIHENNNNIKRISFATECGFSRVMLALLASAFQMIQRVTKPLLVFHSARAVLGINGEEKICLKFLTRLVDTLYFFYILRR